MQHSLNKPIASAAASLVLLQLNKFELAKRFEDVLQVTLGDAEMDIANVQTVERNGAGVVMGRAFASSSLTILLGLRQLGNDRNA